MLDAESMRKLEGRWQICKMAAITLVSIATVILVKRKKINNYRPTSL